MATECATSLLEEDVCFICLDGCRPEEPLVHPCACPRVAHRHCIARWQLTCAGKDEETRCRFCHSVLPDWRPALTPSTLKPAASVMSVRYRGVTYRITYTPGPDGLEHFLHTLQRIGIKVASASQVTFLCRSPDTGEEMSLKGLKAFDAAAYCASITAAKRVIKDADKRQRRQQAAALAQQQHAAHADASPTSEHAADMGVRPEAGPDSPRGTSWCDRQVAHVHAEAFNAASSNTAFGPASSAAAPSDQQAAAQADRAHAAFYALPSSSTAAAVAAQQHLQHSSWWRRALACVHRADRLRA